MGSFIKSPLNQKAYSIAIYTTKQNLHVLTQVSNAFLVTFDKHLNI